jgi:hypothetical protein
LLQVADFVVLQEDDLVLSADGLLWMDHARAKYRNDHRWVHDTSTGACMIHPQVVPRFALHRPSRPSHCHTLPSPQRVFRLSLL